MKYAVIKTGGKQYKVAEGDIIEVERLQTSPNNNVTFSDVLLYKDNENVMFGQPTVEGISVIGKVLDHIRGEKIRVATFKSKVRYRRVKGHRQELSKIKIESIVSSDKLLNKKTENSTKKDEAKPTKKTTRKNT
ncbi:MAG: 50S ribosomal protein L21 [Patescibacteria group bacterium]|nr:MAG: 50S ribosomal protein L21 [Patescibacteria group bacterium]